MFHVDIIPSDWVISSEKSLCLRIPVFLCVCGCPSRNISVTWAKVHIPSQRDNNYQIVTLRLVFMHGDKKDEKMSALSITCGRIGSLACMYVQPVVVHVS